MPELVPISAATRSLQAALAAANATEEPAGNAEVVWLAKLGPMEAAVYTLGAADGLRDASHQARPVGASAAKPSRGAPLLAPEALGSDMERSSKWELDNGQLCLRFNKSSGA